MTAAEQTIRNAQAAIRSEQQHLQAAIQARATAQRRYFEAVLDAAAEEVANGKVGPLLARAFAAGALACRLVRGKGSQ